MKLLFTHAYFYRLDTKQWKTQQPYPPLGTLYAASLMRSLGHTVNVFDTGLSHGPQVLKPALKAFQPEVLVIYDDGFNYLTKMCLTVMREACFTLISQGKEQGAQVVVSSSDSTDHPDLYLAAGADFVLLGEGEITLQELIGQLADSESDMGQIPGLAYSANGQFLRNPKRAVIRELDQLPLPAWDLIDLEPYRQIWQRAQGHFALNIATTRGCPFKCNWCAKPIYGNRYHAHSPAYIVEQIAQLQACYPALNYFWMCDDIFGLKPGWVQAFRDLVQERQLAFKYKIQSRVDLLLQADTIDALAASGLHEVWVGAESGSQKILDAMDKGTKVEQIYEATRLLKEKGIRVCFFLQFGYLGETEADIQKTLDMVLDLMPDNIGISVSYPLPGTKFFEKVKDELKEKANWTDSDDLAMMFRSTFSAPYYKRLHRYVHKRYRHAQAKAQWQVAPHQWQSGSLRRALSALYYGPAAWWDQQRLKKLALSEIIPQ